MPNAPRQTFRPRRWLQFRLRTLLLWVLIFSIPLAWIANERRRIAARREALERVGRCLQVSPQPEWHRWIFGDDAPTNAYRYRAMSSFSDADLVRLKSLSNLRDLDLHDTRVTDAGLAHIEGLNNLVVLRLGCTQVSDAGLAHLKELNNLVSLNLICTQVSDGGLVHLKGLSKLGSLSLFQTQVTDAGLFHLKALKQLEFLGLEHTQATNVGVDALQMALPRCKIER